MNKLVAIFISYFLLLSSADSSFGQADCGCDYTVTKAGVYANSKLNIRPGQTVCIQAGRYDFLRFNGFVGSPGQPIRFINCGGVVSVGVDAYYSGIQFNASRYFVLSGSGDPASPYGFRLDRSNQSASGLSIGGLSSDCEVERVEVAYAGFAGFMIKTDPSCDSTTWRTNFTMYNVTLHDNYIHNTGGEGLYIGHSFYNGVTVNCNGTSKTVYPHLIYGLNVYNNRIEHTAAEGLQYGCAPDAQVHHNVLMYTGVAPFATYQNNGLQISSGSGGDCFSNRIYHTAGIGLIILGHLGNGRIYNNVIYDASQDGIFCDDRPGSLPDTYMVFANNTISRTGRDGIRLYNQDNVNTLVNNVIIQPNAAGNQSGKAFTFMQGATATMITNFTANSPATAAFVNDSTNFELSASSVLIDRGTSTSKYGITLDLMGVQRGNLYDQGAYEFVTNRQPTSGARTAAVALSEGQSLNLSKSTSLTIYPSPAHTKIHVRMPSDQFIDQVTIYTSSGNTAASISCEQPLTTMTCSVQNLQAGIYYLRVLSKAGTLFVERFVKI